MEVASLSKTISALAIESRAKDSGAIITDADTPYFTTLSGIISRYDSDIRTETVDPSVATLLTTAMAHLNDNPERNTSIRGLFKRIFEQYPTDADRIALAKAIIEPAVFRPNPQEFLTQFTELIKTVPPTEPFIMAFAKAFSEMPGIVAQQKLKDFQNKEPERVKFLEGCIQLSKVLPLAAEEFIKISAQDAARYTEDINTLRSEIQRIVTEFINTHQLIIQKIDANNYAIEFEGPITSTTVLPNSLPPGSKAALDIAIENTKKLFPMMKDSTVLASIIKEATQAAAKESFANMRKAMSGPQA